MLNLTFNILLENMQTQHIFYVKIGSEHSHGVHNFRMWEMSSVSLTHLWMKKNLNCALINILLHYIAKCIVNSNMTSFFRFVDKQVIYRWYNLIRTCTGECDWIFHWQHKLCATFSTNVNINYRLPIKVYYRICTLRHIRIEINHGSPNVFRVLTWVGRY